GGDRRHHGQRLGEHDSPYRGHDAPSAVGLSLSLCLRDDSWPDPAAGRVLALRIGAGWSRPGRAIREASTHVQSLAQPADLAPRGRFDTGAACRFGATESGPLGVAPGGRADLRGQSVPAAAIHAVRWRYATHRELSVDRFLGRPLWPGSR